MAGKINFNLIVAFVIFLVAAAGMYVLNQTISEGLGSLTEEEQRAVTTTQMHKKSPPRLKGKPVTINPASDPLAPVLQWKPAGKEKLQEIPKAPIRERPLDKSVLIQ